MNNSSIVRMFLRGLLCGAFAAAVPAAAVAGDSPQEAATQASLQFEGAGADLGQALRAPEAAAAAAPISYTADLAQLYNRHLVTPLIFSARGAKVYATGGMNPAQPDKSYLVLSAPGQGAVIIDIHGYLAVTEHATTFAINGEPLLLVGVYGYPNPYEDSSFTVSTYAKDASGKPTPVQQLLRVTVSELKQALYSKGQALRFGDEEYRLFYGDAVTRSADNTHFELGPIKGLVFAQRYKDGSYNNDPVPLDVNALANGKTASLALSKKTMVSLSLSGDTLTIKQSGGK